MKTVPFPKTVSSSKLLPLIIAAGLAVGIFLWYFCRIEPGDGQIAVLVKKTGKDLPSSQILAPGPEYKGIQLNVLGEGRYFRNPYTWDWEILKITDIPAGSFGVLVRKFGKDLPEGKIIAPDSGYKGIVREVLGTGKHRINPYAYDVKKFNDIRIMPGNVGVVTNLVGDDLFSGTTNDITNEKGFLTDPKRKGVQRSVLKEGTHRINPFIQSVAIVNIQSQRYEFSGKDSIGFITVDGFNISLEGTVEFNILTDYAPNLTQEVGDMEDVMKKLILPSVSGFARIEGSKKSATEFIIGESRQIFQNQLEDYLRRNCRNWGVSINSVLIRDIRLPQEIAEIVRNRELAKQEAKKFTQQIEQAKSAMTLEEQRMLAVRKKAVVEAETRKITSEISAKQRRSVRVVEAQTSLDAARIHYKTAQADSEASLKKADAEKQIVTARNKAEAEILRRNVEAYGGGAQYVRGLLFEKLSPQIKSILTNDGDNRTFGLPVGAAGGK